MPSGSSGSGKISSRYFAIWAKNKNLVGRSGIRVLVVGFSQIGALKKHPALVFILRTWNFFQLELQSYLSLYLQKKKKRAIGFALFKNIFLRYHLWVMLGDFTIENAKNFNGESVLNWKSIKLWFQITSISFDIFTSSCTTFWLTLHHRVYYMWMCTFEWLVHLKFTLLGVYSKAACRKKSSTLENWLNRFCENR